MLEWRRARDYWSVVYSWTIHWSHVVHPEIYSQKYFIVGHYLQSKKTKQLMLKEQLIISVSFVTSHLCSKMSLSYSDCSMWREYMLYFFPLPFPHSLSLSLPVPKMSLLGILSPGSFWSSGLSLPPLSCNLWGITLWSTHSPPHCLRTVTAYNNCYAN